MLPEKIIFLGVLLNLIGEFSYVLGIVYGNVKPNLVSWFIWMLSPFIAVFFQLKAGAGLSVLPVFMAGFGPFLVILVSAIKRNTQWKISRFDIVCGACAVIALFLYILTHNLEISIFFLVLSEFLAVIPTLKKAWSFPETESGYIFLCAIVSNILGLLIIKEWSFTIYSYGLSLIIINIALVVSIYRKKILLWYNP